MAFQNPFGNQNTTNKTASTAGGFQNPFAGYTPPPQSQQKPNNPQEPTGFGGFPLASIVSPQALQQSGNWLGDLGNSLFNGAKEAIKQVVDFIPKLPDYAAQAVKNPGTTAAMAGASALTGFADIAGAIENGVASAVGITVPDRWNVSKQSHALTQLNDDILQHEGLDQQKAGAVGNFIGTFLPFALSAEAVGASVGAKFLVPTAEKFLPGAVKFIPTITNAITALGMGQISHNEENGSRIDQFKNDLIMLSMFEVGGLAARGLSAGTKGLIKNTLKDVKGEKVVDFETVQPKIEQVKQAIQQDLGQPAEVYAAKQIAAGEVGNTPSKLGLRVEQTAIEKKLVTELQDLPGYEKMNMKEQAQLASDLIKNDPQKAMNIALGVEEPPKGLKSESVFKALESSITTAEQAIELAKSPLVTEASYLGQRIKALDVKTSDSPVEAIKQVINAREAKIRSSSGQTVNQAVNSSVKEIQESIKKAAPQKKDWASFIKEIQC